MRVEQGGSSRRPISLNDEFFDRLASLIEEVRESALRVVAEENHLSLEKTRAIVDAPDPKRGRPPKRKEPQSIEEFEREYRARERQYQREAVKRSLQSYTSTYINLSYVSGYSFKPNSLEELRDILIREPGRQESLSVRAGAGHTGLGFSIRFTNNITRTMTFEVTGERKEAEHLYRRLVDILRACEPDHSWLHSLWLNLLLSVLGAIIVTVALILLYVRYWGTEGMSLPPGIAIMAVGWLVSWILSHQLTYAFPKLQFEYGPEWRQKKARRTVIFALFSVLVIPLLIAVIA